MLSFEHCEYGQALDEMLRHSVVCGQAQVRSQQRLQAEVDLTFDKAMKIAQAVELAEHDAKELRQAEVPTVEPAHKVSEQSVPAKNPEGRNPCFRCGAWHDPTQWRFKNAECCSCGKKGHIKKVCRSKLTSPQAPGRSKSVHSAHQDTQAHPSEYTMYPFEVQCSAAGSEFTYNQWLICPPQFPAQIGRKKLSVVFLDN